MNKLKESLAAKITAMALVIISLLLLAAGFAGMLSIDAMGGYQSRKEDMLQKGYKEICRRYSIAAMAGYLEQYDAEELLQTNFRYGIVKVDDEGQVDFTDPHIYTAGNLEKTPDDGELYLEEFDIGDNAWFNVEDGNLLNAAHYSWHSSDISNVSYDINGWYYDRETGSFYVRSEDALFPIPDEAGMLQTVEGDELPLHMAEHCIVEDPSQDSGYAWENCWAVSFYDASVNPACSDIQIVNGGLDEFAEVQEKSPAYFEGDAFFVRREAQKDHYVVASYVNLPLAGEQSFEEGDLFVQMKLLIDLAYQIRYVCIVILIPSLLVLIAAFAFLMAAAGHRKGQEGVRLSFMDHVPLDLYFAGVFTAEILIFCMVAVFMESAAHWAENGLSGVVSSAVVIMWAGILAVLLGIAYCMSFAVRVKLGKWWRHTVIYMILKKCMHLLFAGLRFCFYALGGLCRSFTLLGKAWLALCILAFVEFVAIQMSYMDPRYMAFWMLEKIILYPLIIFQLMQMNKLQKGAQRIANGQLDYQIDTTYMFWEIKKHGEYLNDIGHGINSAVNERMKSEHFKTELITNVSHDIKTPLTSIINYVDLLEKEDIGNPRVQEYLEVLHRQSARLKKLIEDLMEASKASTGSLSVIMEKCDAGVMLVQTIGEFEERLMTEQIELQVRKPETEIFIEADHRHLWRVFDNLMTNICKYAQPMTRAYVNLEQNGQQAVIIFRNISKYQLNISSEELMERFVRGDSSRNTEGSGLGISIAKSLTELMDGTFELVVDGDLFKVVLTFPLYGTLKIQSERQKQKPELIMKDFEKDKNRKEKKDSHMLDGLTAGIQNAGSYAAGFGQGVADKTGQMFRRAGRFAHHVRQAAELVKAEEAAEQNAETPDVGDLDAEAAAEFVRETERR